MTVINATRAIHMARRRTRDRQEPDHPKPATALEYREIGEVGSCPNLRRLPRDIQLPCYLVASRCISNSS